MKSPEPRNPLHTFFFENIDSFSVGELSADDEPVKDYLAGLLTRFAHVDELFAIRAQDGSRVGTIFDLLAEADVRQNATSFERERTVHKHIGDYILFWSGVNPEVLAQAKQRLLRPSMEELVAQGRESYSVVSTFEYQPYADEAPLFRRLSEVYESCALILNRVRNRVGLCA